MTLTAPKSMPPKSIASDLEKAAIADVLAELKADPDHGLTSSEANQRLTGTAPAAERLPAAGGARE